MRILWINLILIAFTHNGYAKAIDNLLITGWPVPSLETITQQPSAALTHPVLGPLACPALLVSPTKEKNNHLKPLIQVARISEKDKVWVFNLDSKQTWWDGSPVSPADLKGFLADNLPKISSVWPGNGWKTPKFTVEHNANSVRITFAKAPSFGPYTLTRIPFFKKVAHNGLPFQCAGAYSLGRGSSPRELVMHRRGKNGKYPKITLSTQANSKAHVAFQSASAFGGSPWVRMSDEKAQCKNHVNIPAFTIVEWNQSVDPTNNTDIRKALTMATPRGEILRAGAGHIGDLVSAPIPRNHPGYNRAILVRPFDLSKASKELSQQGFPRKTKTGPRTYPNGQPLTLRIGLTSAQQELLPKIIGDALSLVGINVEFVKWGTKTDLPIHGWLRVIEPKMPGSDLSRPLLGAAANATSQIGPLVKQFSHQLSYGRPNFKVLKNLHGRLYEEEPITVLLQHRVCMKQKGIKLPRLSKSALLQHDWLAKHLM